jgi:hypothetical protein
MSQNLHSQVGKTDAESDEQTDVLLQVSKYAYTRLISQFINKGIESSV